MLEHPHLLSNVARTGKDGPISSAEFVVGGQLLMGYNGGPYFSFSEGVSLYVDCADQDEVDEYWDRLVQAGAKPTACGWIKDPFGQATIFTATLLTGHKGTALPVPFDPAAHWNARPVRLRPGRRGYIVHGTLNGRAFESAVVARSRRFFVLVSQQIQDELRLSIGTTVKVSLSPGPTAAPLARARSASRPRSPARPA
ncbi:MAG: VOC family protein [Acidobacteriota bacterium]